MPLNYSIAAREQLAAPPMRGGVTVEFPVQPIRAYTGRLTITSQGAIILPAYGQLTVQTVGEPVISPIGSQSEFYLENLAPGP